MAALEATSKEADGTREKLMELVSVAKGCPSTFDENSMFSGPSSMVSPPLIPPLLSKRKKELTRRKDRY